MQTPWLPILLNQSKYVPAVAVHSMVTSSHSSDGKKRRRQPISKETGREGGIYISALWSKVMVYSGMMIIGKALQVGVSNRFYHHEGWGHFILTDADLGIH